MLAKLSFCAFGEAEQGERPVLAVRLPGVDPTRKVGIGIKGGIVAAAGTDADVGTAVVVAAVAAAPADAAAAAARWSRDESHWP